MQGEMDYDESLRQRVALLAGLDVKVLDQIANDLPLTEGAETLIRVLKRLGYRTAVISGGFSRAAEALKRRLGIDYAFSNNLEIEGGKLTGRVVGPIVNAQRKAELLETDRAAGGRASGSGDRRRRRRQRRVDAGKRGPGHRLSRQDQAARGGRHDHFGLGPGRDLVPAGHQRPRAAGDRHGLTD